MANDKKINFKRVMGKIFSWIWYGIKETGIAIAVVLLVTMIFAVFYCWPAFILWCIFAPKFAANLLYSKKTEGDFPVAMGIFQALNGWIVCILPFFWKKRFMTEHGIDNYSVRLQKKYYFNYKRTTETVKQMSDEAYKALWYSDELHPKDFYNLVKGRKDSKEIFSSLSCPRQIKAYGLLGKRIEIIEMMSSEAVELMWDTSRDLKEDYTNIVLAGVVLDDFHFEQLVKEVPEMVAKYVVKHTPTDGMLNVLFSRKDKFKDIIAYCIKRYGISPKSIRNLEKLDLLDEFDNSLKEFTQRTFLQRHDNCTDDKKLVKVFFEENKTILPSAQIVMKPWQYRLFNEAGHKLDDEVFESFLEKEDIPMLTVIFELDPDIQGTDVAMAIVMANPKLTDLLMSIIGKK